MTNLNDSSSVGDKDSSNSLEAQAKKRVDAKLGFLTHLLVFCCVNAGFYLLGLLSDRSWHFGHAPFPIWGWGLGLLIHGIVTWASLQGQDLRGSMMEREMQRLKQRQV
ncbi:2TM domain-containing protein [Paucibacter sp. TC2R-5]|uniref:2TM domain-containing protein n=1 Tax=Paucibacter sp. TC2R-5 TaxID=2893555 RepID=UPI0021E4F592|nr:2TM domain-containing protein [Paucibacter sp. TC2R-5]MCV2357573.1 2TM domain-containing protein [Paucibacter sp. TC2R-5]